ncbi:hypothetical protein K466DRAFT_562131 [Polyporus arcularius HHB13444]|uniref:Uncharacterized protein n=1 Tax=Polyporus arcularius HHB13444 TaxID=1314778 RepID=A0A5C3PVI0_9APHY|nr:hypothetical protein K466DRAFT_562131 [Polyporus arcularius HHB13444]
MPTSATTVEDSELAEQGSRFIGRRMPILPKRLPHPLDLLSPDYQLARAMDYFEQAQRLVDEVGEDPDWRNRQEFADLVYDIGKICETINNLLERPQWPLSKCTRVKHESRDACALAKVGGSVLQSMQH